MDKKMKVAVVGCGAISDIYLTNMIERFDNLEVVACCAAHFEHAQKKAQKYGIKACTYEEILSDDAIEMVVILTPAPTHEELIRRAIEAGKHVYTEKTMTLSHHTAEKLVSEAQKKRIAYQIGARYFFGSSIADS